MKRFLVFLVTLMVVPGLLLLSADKPKSKKGEIVVQSGTRVNWSDIAIKGKASERTMKPVMNFEGPKKIVKQSKAVDKFAQTSPTLDREAKIPSPTITFDGMNLSSHGAGWPPDTNGDVGLNYYVQTVNTSIGIYNKSTGAQVSTTTFDAFFPSAVGSPCDNDNNGDPIVHFDPYNQRWVLYDFAWSGTNNGSYFSIAASQTSDPTGAWWTYCLQADSNLMNDYPKSGVWHDGIYITANMFLFSGSFQHAKIWVLKKPDIYNGTLTVQSFTDGSYEAWSLLPSNAKGTTAPPAGTPNYMFAMDADEYGGGAIDAIYWWKLSVDWGIPGYTWQGPYTMTTGAFGLTASRVPQPGTSNTLDSLYGRLMYPANYRKAPTEAVYLNHLCEYAGERQTRWYEIRISGGTCSIYQQGTYAPNSDHHWMGSIAGDKNGAIALGYSVSSSSTYPSIRYTGRTATDTLNTLPQGEGVIMNGTGSQTSYARWGDYSGISIDPVDDETFWYTNEYLTTTSYWWRTRVGAFKISSVIPDPPAAPSALTAVAPSLPDCEQIDLDWTDNATDEDGFKIERDSGSGFTQIATVGANVTSYSDTAAAPGSHSYRVRAYNAGGDSAYSNTAGDTALACPAVPPAAPTIGRVKPGRGSVTINWTDNAGDEDGYRIYRGLSAGSLSLVATLPADTTSYSDTGLANKTTYYYKVCAYNTNGEGCSGVFSATTK